MASKSNYTVVIDLGTSKIVGLAGQKTEEGKIKIEAVAQVPSKGVKRGVVFNIDNVASSVNLLLNQLESETEEEISKVYITFAGQHMKTVDFQGGRFTSDEGIISKFDINELYNEAASSEVEPGYKIMHVIPQSFVIDEEIKELDPVGITGKKLEASYKLLLVPEIHILNLQRVFDKVGVEIAGITLSPLAISKATLTDDEKEIGAIVLDMGAGTTTLAVYFESILIHTAVIPFGGSVITKDIKEGCSILLKWAEQLKVKYGEALGDFADEQKVVTIPGYNGWEPKEITFKSLSFIIQARLEEIIDNVNFQIEKSGIENQLGSGIVITGGTSKLNNIVSLIKFRTGMDVRVGFSVINPVNRKKVFQNQDFLAALGLLKLILDDDINSAETEKHRKKKQKKDQNGISSWKKVVQGVLDYIDDDNDDLAMN